MAAPRSVVLAASLLLAFGPALRADTLHVDASLATGANDGSSWADAFQGSNGLRLALTAAVSGDRIFVAQGSYLPTDTGSRSISFGLISGVQIYGGFLGTETEPEQRPPFGSAPSVLSGDLAGDDGGGQFGDNSFHVVNGAGSNASALLDGFEVRSGAATGAGGNNDRGGGILCTGSASPTIRNCRFVANRSTFGGGAGYINNGAAPSFTDCSFEDGVGGAFGGAFDIAGGGAVRFERCLFRGNTAARAGALEIFSTTGVVVNNCVFTGNVATGTSGGGAIWIGSGGNPVFRNCTVVGNVATMQTVAGLRNQGATLATVANCIFVDNEGPGGSQNPGNQINAANTCDYSLVEGGFGGTGTGNIDGDPLFVNAAGGDFALTAASPAIDAGSNALLVSGATTDYAGLPRQADALFIPDTGAGPAPVVDIGAHEYPSAWLQLGQSLDGVFGAPLLLLDGPLTGPSTVTVSLSNANPGATAWYVLGFTQLGAPFKGGVMVPDVNALAPFALTPFGSLAFAYTWPAGVPSGFSTFHQFWIVDPAGPFGFAASNAVQGTTP